MESMAAKLVRKALLHKTKAAIKNPWSAHVLTTAKAAKKESMPVRVVQYDEHGDVKDLARASVLARGFVLNGFAHDNQGSFLQFGRGCESIRTYVYASHTACAMIFYNADLVPLFI